MKKILFAFVVSLSGLFYTYALTSPLYVELTAPWANYQESGAYATTSVTWWWTGSSSEAISGFIIKLNQIGGSSTFTFYAPPTTSSSSNITVNVPIFASSSSYYNAEVAAYQVSSSSTTTSLFASSSVVQIVKSPDAPSSLDAKLKANGNVKLTWNDNSQNETNFAIYRWKKVSGSYVLDRVFDVVKDTTTYTDSTVVSGKTYKYGIYGYNWFGLSGYSNYTVITP